MKCARTSCFLEPARRERATTSRLPDVRSRCYYGYRCDWVRKDDALGHAVITGRKLRQDLSGCLAAEGTQSGSYMAKERTLEVTKLTVAPSRSGSLFHGEAYYKIPTVAVNREAWNSKENPIQNVCLKCDYMRSHPLI